ncbi:MAG: lycopene cyclase domain-containing protein [Elusimicrobiota bacterium]
MPNLPERPEIKTTNGVPWYRRGKWWPAWAILILPFIFIFAPLYRRIKDQINWRAIFAMIVVSEIILTIAEHNSIQRGHWVYNEARILGPRIWGIPIEEPLIYYWLPQILAVIALLFIRSLLKNSKK